MGEEHYRFTTTIDMEVDLKVNLWVYTYEGDDMYKFKDIEITGMKIEEVNGELCLVPTGFKIHGEITDALAKTALGYVEIPDWLEIDADSGLITIKEVPEEMKSKSKLSAQDLFEKIEGNADSAQGNLVTMRSIDKPISEYGRIHGDIRIDFEKT